MIMSLFAFMQLQWLELLRKRLVLIPAIVLALVALGAFFIPITRLDDSMTRVVAGQVVLNGCVWMLRLAALVIALIAATGVIADEISDGTMLLIAMRPVRRWIVVAGKLLGLAVFLGVYLVAGCTLIGAALGVRVSDMDLALQGLNAGLVSTAAVLAFAVVSATASTVVTSRMAIILSALAWASGKAAGLTVNVFSNDDIGPLESYRFVGEIANVVTYILPKERLDTWSQQQIGGLISSADVTTSVAWWQGALGIVVIFVWAIGACLLFERRRNLT